MLKGIKKVLIDIFNLFYKVIYGYARWVLAVVIVIICAQVFCRNILRTNIRWNQEVALLLTIWMAFLGIAIGAEKNLHIGVELFYDKFPVKIRNVIDVLNRIITLLVGAFFTVYGVRMVLVHQVHSIPKGRRLYLIPFQYQAVIMDSLVKCLCQPGSVRTFNHFPVKCLHVLERKAQYTYKINAVKTVKG